MTTNALHKRRLLDYAIGWAVLICLVTSFRTATADELPWPSFFHAEGRHLVADANGARCCFRGVNLAGLEYGAFFVKTYPGSLGVNFFQPEVRDLAQVAAWGFNCVRLPFEWARLVPGYRVGAPVSLNAEYLGLIDQVVGWAAAQRLYVILDMHDYLKYWSGSNQQVFVDNEPDYRPFLAETWRKTAAHFAANPAILGYELMNEPARYDGPGKGGDSNWHAIAQSVIHAIRTADTNHLVLVDGRNYSLPGIWQRDNGPHAFVHDEISPPRLAYCPHVYFNVAGDSRYKEGVAPVADWCYYVRDRLLPIIDWAETNNVPIMITESGIPNTAAWAALLSTVFDDFFEPLRLSNIYWLYDPRHSTSELQLNANSRQLSVLRAHPGGAYTDLQPVHLAYRHSPLYDGALVPPWRNASWLSPGDEIDFDAALPCAPGQRGIRVGFANEWSALKFYHEYLDTRRYAALQFKIRGGAPGGQDILLFTENRRRQASSKTKLSNYALPDNETRTVRIPLADLVAPDDPVITSVVFQNGYRAQPAFFIWDIVLLPTPPYTHKSRE